MEKERILKWFGIAFLVGTIFVLFGAHQREFDPVSGAPYEYFDFSKFSARMAFGYVIAFACLLDVIWIFQCGLARLSGEYIPMIVPVIILIGLLFLAGVVIPNPLP